MNRAMRYLAHAFFFLLSVAFVLSATARAEIVDRIVAVVDGQVITWSAALQEANFQAFQIGAPPVTSLDPQKLRSVVSHMIDQLLLEQESARLGFTLNEASDKDTAPERDHKRFPTEQDFRKALERYGLNEQQAAARAQREMEILSFVDLHLRPQAHPTPEMIQSYYTQTLVPELQSEGQPHIPPLQDVSAKIEQVLVEQEINRLLEDWVRELRTRARITMIDR